MTDYSKLSIEERKALNAKARKKLAEGAISGVKKVGKFVLGGAGNPLKQAMDTAELFRKKQSTSDGYMLRRRTNTKKRGTKIKDK